MNVLVLGADRGLGRVLVRMLHERGFDVTAGYYDIGNAEEMEDVLQLPMDVMSDGQLESAKEKISEKKGGLDAVIHVAGVLLPSDRTCTLMDAPLADISRHLEVNAVGLVQAFRILYPVMKRGSRYFAVTSEGGSFTLAGTLYPAYSVSKTAANKFVQVLRLTVGSDPVDLIAVHPGRMNTEMGRDTHQIEPEESAEGFIRLLDGTTKINSQENWFIDYTGKPMPV